MLYKREVYAIVSRVNLSCMWQASWVEVREQRHAMTGIQLYPLLKIRSLSRGTGASKACMTQLLNKPRVQPLAIDFDMEIQLEVLQVSATRWTPTRICCCLKLLSEGLM